MILQRLTHAIFTPLDWQDWRIVILGLCVYGLVALPLGFLSGFLQFHLVVRLHWAMLRDLVKVFFFPALVEEIIFRVLLIPHPFERVSKLTWVFWMVLSLGLFIIYHPFNALTFYPPGNPTFFNPIFLILAGLLGLVCAIVYRLTGSLWGIVIIHGLVVFLWLYVLDGIKKLKLTLD
ncbi:MAG: CPBP family glutamic-type intramembrane protease [Cyanobacteriota bacterium]|nr:CPBP family glutamic-type intramembrane protease [Cyanobacteriota bacterium]